MKYILSLSVIVLLFGCSKKQNIARVDDYYSFKGEKKIVFEGRERTSSFYIPNVFTPNGDNINELFVAKGFFIKKLSVKIYNSTGLRVFEDDVEDKDYIKDLEYIKWDGRTKNGRKCTEGIFHVKVSFTTYTGETKKCKMKIYLLTSYTKTPDDISYLVFPEELDPEDGIIYGSEDKVNLYRFQNDDDIF